MQGAALDERRRAEAGAAELQALFAALADVILVLDGDGRYLRIAPSGASLLYRPAEELLGKTVHEVFPTAQADAFVAQIRRALELRQPVRVDYSLPIGDAEVFFEGSVAPLGADSVVWVARDVSERRRAEKVQAATFQISQAAHAAPTLEELFVAIHAIVAELMPAKNLYIALCDGASDMIRFPYSVDEFDARRAPRKPRRGLTEYVLRTGEPLLATPEVFAELEQRGEVVLSGTRAVDWLGVPLKTDGTTVGVLAVQSYTKGVRYSEADKDLLQFVATQVAMVIERRRAEEALRQSETLYRSLVEHAVYGIYRSTLDGHMVAANPALVEMLGYTSEDEILAQDMTRNIYADPAERERLIARYHDAERYDGVETEWKRKDGSPLAVRLSGRPVRREDGALEGFEMVVEDVTERRRLEGQLRQAQKMEAIGQLAGGVAHDFNNLLTAVLTSCELLGDELPADSPHAEDLHTICSAAQHGAELTRKLLAFSRRQPLEVRKVSLAVVANDFLAVARRVVPEDLDVAVRIDVPETTVNADPGAIEQILMNLVTNARDATPAGGRIVIEVGRRALDEEYRRTYGWGRPGDYVTLTVSDTGCGMDAATQRRIFEPFFTTKPVGQGTGLGMSMVYGLVKEHDGFVHVYSEVGHGTTVRVYFPVVTGEGAPPARPAAPDIRGGSETILLVEDDVSVRRAATRVLEKYGYSVLSATDGYEALDILDKREALPDLVVSDVVMPRISGPHLLSKLRETGQAPKMLFTSGYTARDVVERAQLEPGQPFLTKPWTVTDLLRKVREVLNAPGGG